MWIPIENVVNEYELVCEMANKYKEETGLPMNIWIAIHEMVVMMMPPWLS